MYGKCVYTLEIDFRDVVLRRYVFQNPARINVMTQLRPWNDLDRKDQKRHRERKSNVTLIYFYANNLPKIKLRTLPTDDSGRPTGLIRSKKKILLTFKSLNPCSASDDEIY